MASPVASARRALEELDAMRALYGGDPPRESEWLLAGTLDSPEPSSLSVFEALEEAVADRPGVRCLEPL